MEANKNYTFEETELRPRLVGYKNIFKKRLTIAANVKRLVSPLYKVMKIFAMLADDSSIKPKTKCIFF